MKNYQKPEMDYVVLTTAEEIANSTQTPGAEGGVVSNPFANWSVDNYIDN